MDRHDKKLNKFIYYWLVSSLFLIFSMIIIGGLTRITNSGLSITEWELFTGIFPPLSHTAWENYFNLYKQIPQFKIVNPTMSLDEFKVIFYWEYFHRILGRIVGLFFIIPLIFLHIAKKINFRRLIIFYSIFGLILLQGIIGWYMVSSGLVNNITVSHYRLSLHLVVAIIILSIIFWQILDFRSLNSKSFFDLSKQNLPYLILIFLIFVQVVIGAFVSGLDAGKIYQTWPLMNSNYFPDDFDFNYKIDLLNFENHSLVQFYHRNIAYIIFGYVLILSYLIFYI